MTTSPILLEAIALKKCVRTIYNGVSMKLAPHVLYAKNNALFVDAITLEKHGEPPRDRKLGAFHLQGLNELRVVDEHFEPDPLFEPDAQKYEGVALFKV
jgi:hypothetical protein